jgi:ABC-type sugar transport system ATPase subunit
VTAVELTGVSKHFGGVQALRGVDCVVEPGEVRALMGENGSGKSTLIRVMAGIVVPDAGTVRADGVSLPHGDLSRRRASGIDVLGQDPEVCPSFTVAENVFMGRWPSRKGRTDRERMVRQTAEVVEREQLPLDPRAIVGSLSQDARHLVEVARVAVHQPRVVAFDETTASLTVDHVERMFAFIRRLRDRGTAVLFVSHRLPEVLALCDSVTVLRDGKLVATEEIAETDEDRIVRQMVGRELSRGYQREPTRLGPVQLRVSELRPYDASIPLDLEVHAGEVVGLAGLVESGRSSILESVFGLRGRASGTVECDGRPVPPDRPAAAIIAGMGLVPEDRRRQGLAMSQSVFDNTALLQPTKRGLLRLVSRRRVRAAIASLREQVGLKAPDDGAPVGTLSGGNQQKVVLGRWLEEPPRVLLLDEPTRGIDVGARREIYDLIDALAQNGTAILLATSELPELMALADRVLVMREGRCVARFGEEADEGRVGAAMVGAGGAQSAAAGTRQDNRTKEE